MFNNYVLYVSVLQIFKHETKCKKKKDFYFEISPETILKVSLEAKMTCSKGTVHSSWYWCECCLVCAGMTCLAKLRLQAGTSRGCVLPLPPLIP